ncbi:MAG TPA: ABC transporter permease [Pirellulales bacterium]|nr:ABC transporter permease [Pirellulales bacterium]
MNHPRDLLHDLNELSQLQPDVATTQRAIEKVRAALTEVQGLQPLDLTAVFRTRALGAKLMRPRTLVVIAAAAVILIFAAQWLPSNSSGNIAFAQVQEEVAKTKSVQYLETENDATTSGASSATILRNVSILGESRKREEITFNFVGLADFDLIVSNDAKNDGASHTLAEQLGEQIAGLQGVDRVAYGMVDVISLDHARGILLQGWPLDSPVFDRLTVMQGRRLKAEEKRQAMIGFKLAERLNKKIGDTVALHQEPFEIIGIYESGNGYENLGLVVSLEELQRLTNHYDQVSGFLVRAKRPIDKNALQELREHIKKLQPDIAVRLVAGLLGPNVVITDLASQKAIYLQPADKTCEMVPAGTGLQGFDAAFYDSLPPSKVDLYELIRNVPTAGAKFLGQRTFAGKALLGYSIEKEEQKGEGTETWNRTYWVDPTTKLPVRIETSHRSTAFVAADKDSLISNIVFDAPIDPKLFSLAPPAGYTDSTAVAKSNPTPKAVDGKATEFVFADVQDEVAKATTTQYTETSKYQLSGDGATNTKITRVQILGDSLKREDQQLRTIDKNGNDVRPEDSRHSISVFDANKEKLMAWYPDRKGYIVNDYATPQTPPEGKKSTAAQLHMIGGLADWLRNVPVNKAKRLPEKMINGKSAVGFLVEEKYQDALGKNQIIVSQQTYWIDPTTKLPVRIESSILGSPKKPDETIDGLPRFAYSGDSASVVSEIVFDAPLDEKLFTLEPPAGYTNLRALKPTTSPDKPGG